MSAGLQAFCAWAPIAQHAAATARSLVHVYAAFPGRRPACDTALADRANDALGIETAVRKECLRIAVLDESVGKSEVQHGNRYAVGGERFRDRQHPRRRSPRSPRR
jgi:hypothetical protein